MPAPSTLVWGAVSAVGTAAGSVAAKEAVTLGRQTLEQNWPVICQTVQPWLPWLQQVQGAGAMGPALAGATAVVGAVAAGQYFLCSQPKKRRVVTIKLQGIHIEAFTQEKKCAMENQIRDFLKQSNSTLQIIDDVEFVEQQAVFRDMSMNPEQEVLFVSGSGGHVNKIHCSFNEQLCPNEFTVEWIGDGPPARIDDVRLKSVQPIVGGKVTICQGENDAPDYREYSFENPALPNKVRIELPASGGQDSLGAEMLEDRARQRWKAEWSAALAAADIVVGVRPGSLLIDVELDEVSLVMLAVGFAMGDKDLFAALTGGDDRITIEDMVLTLCQEKHGSKAAGTAGDAGGAAKQAAKIDAATVSKPNADMTADETRPGPTLDVMKELDLSGNWLEGDGYKKAMRDQPAGTCVF